VIRGSRSGKSPVSSVPARRLNTPSGSYSTQHDQKGERHISLSFFVVVRLWVSLPAYKCRGWGLLGARA
jgi:hypothetical protein